MSLTGGALTLPASRPASWAWPAVAFAFGWFLVLRANWWEWSLNPQYSYGVLVPILSLLLLGRRWADRPSPARPGRRGQMGASIVLLAAGLVLAALQPIQLSNADWRMVPALASGAGVTMTLALIFLVGGLPWLKHFAFPVLFFLVAVPWPRPQENAIMSWLMLRNSALIVEALQWMGYAAEQRGNLIAIPGSLLGVVALISEDKRPGATAFAKSNFFLAPLSQRKNTREKSARKPLENSHKKSPGSRTSCSACARGGGKEGQERVKRCPPAARSRFSESSWVGGNPRRQVRIRMKRRLEAPVFTAIAVEAATAPWSGKSIA